MLERAVKVLNAAQMRAMDAYTINEIGIPGIVLMENAGRAVVDAIEDHFQNPEAITAAVFCGKGNNGGDGFVIARHLIARGHEAVVYLLAEIDDLSGDALTNARIAESIGVEIREIPDRSSFSEMHFEGHDYNLIVDAIFGTGLSSAIRGHYLGAVDLINNSGRPVVAVDMPSGLSADSGEILGPTVEADLTVSFAYPKLGHVLPPASAYVGELVVADISIPEIAEGDDLNTMLVTEDLFDPLRLYREPGSHKGTFGHLLVVAGARGTAGAAAMVGGSALLSGAGLVTVATPHSVAAVVDSLFMETMTLPLKEESGALHTDAVQEIIESLEGKTAVATGPGLGTGPGAEKAVRRLLAESQVPLILDADAINVFAGAAEDLVGKLADIIITPHPGEMARLIGSSVEEVQKNRITCARNLARENGIYVVLKGYRTVVAEPGGDVYINMSGNPGMATAGSGDILTGMIGGLLAQRDMTVLEAAVAGVYLHGLAGDIASEKVGQISCTASAIMESISSAFMMLEHDQQHEHGHEHD